MSDFSKILDDIVESKLLELHTSFLAKVVDIKEIDETKNEYSIKPLAKYKEYGRKAEEYPVITKVYKCSRTKPNKGDIVLCVALERDITNLSGSNSHLPLTGVHHRINDAIIVDVVDI